MAPDKARRGQATGRFAARCVDTSEPGYPTVASFEMDGWDLGTLRILAGIVGTQEQLDELVVLSFAVMDYFRVIVRSNGGVQRRPVMGGGNDQQLWMALALNQQAQNQQAQGN